MQNRCNKLKSCEVPEQEPSCYDQNLRISFDYSNLNNETSKVFGFLTQEKGAPIMEKQLTTDVCKRIKRLISLLKLN